MYLSYYCRERVGRSEPAEFKTGKPPRKALNKDGASGRNELAPSDKKLNLQNRATLFAEFETLDYAVVAVERVLFEVVKKLSAAARHSDKAAARVEVFLVCGKVRGEVRDARAQNRDLHFAGTRVFFVETVFLDYRRFVYCIVV